MVRAKRPFANAQSPFECSSGTGEITLCLEYPNGSTDASDAIASQTDRGYIGEETLTTIGLMHLNARLYDPLTGRFMSADPIGLKGGSNPYAYAGNNPLTFSDPSGLCFLGCFWKKVFKSPIFKAVASIAAVATFNYEVLPALEFEAGLSASVTTFGISQASLTAVNAGVAGAIGGAISTGTWQGTLIGAATAVGFSAVGDLKADWHIDPTGGAKYFFMGGSNLPGTFQGQPLLMQLGPFNNAVPSAGIPRNAYIGIYGRGAPTQ